jgi:hypothetical protein
MNDVQYPSTKSEFIAIRSAFYTPKAHCFIQRDGGNSFKKAYC